MLNAEIMYQHIDHPERFHPIEIFESIDSTQTYLLTQAKQSSPLSSSNQNRICFAKQQTAGRGRQGRHWYSTPESSLLFSVLWHFPKTPKHISGLSIATALAIINGFQQSGMTANFQIKWPNDIVWQQQKCAGVLLDFQHKTKIENSSQSSVVIGIGINIQLPTDSPIEQPFTDLCTITDQKNIDRNILSGHLINALSDMLITFDDAKHWENIREQWKRYDALYQKHIEIQVGDNHYEGIANGIGAKGELQLIATTGNTQTFFAGDVTKIQW